MNWIATNIRFPEDQYIKLKIKAAKERRSVAAVIREATEKMVEIEPQETQIEREKRAKKIMDGIRKVARENAKYTKGFDSVKALREIRYQQE